MNAGAYLIINFKKSFELNETTEIPHIFKDISFRKGAMYVWGIGSNYDIDIQNERVKLDAEKAEMLEIPPYNKLYLEHDSQGKNTGLGSVGVIKFSKIIPEMDSQHIILAELNEHHPMIKNIWGSIQNGNIDSFSIAGTADRISIYNPETNKSEKIAIIKKPMETSLTSMPANAGAGILGSFIAKNKMEAIPMETNNFITAEVYQKDIGEIKDTLKSMTESIGKTSEALKTIHEGFTGLKKSLEEDETTVLDTEKVAKTEEPKKGANKDATKNSEMEEQLKKNTKELEEIKKSLTNKRIGLAHSERVEDYFEKTANGFKYVPKSETPLIDMILGGK